MRRAGTTRSSPFRRRTPGWPTCRTSTTSPSSTGWRSSTSSRPTRTSSRASRSRVPSGSGAPRPRPRSRPPASAPSTPGTNRTAVPSTAAHPPGCAAVGVPAGCAALAPDGSDAVTTPSQQPTAAPDAVATEIAAGYAFTGPALEFGSVVHGGTAHPSAQVRVPLSMMNRHGLIAGATGTGKTKTLQLLAEQLSAQGVPVVLADVKGDLSGLARPGEPSDRITARAADTADDWAATGYPAEFVALGGLGTGVPLRATITSFGPVLLSKVLDLNATQASSLALVFHYADSAG